jgi:hypothetical protein
VDTVIAVHKRTRNGRQPARVSVLSGIVIGMRRRIHDQTYRSTAELMRAIRDEHLLTQNELAGRTSRRWPSDCCSGRPVRVNHCEYQHDRS